MDTVLEACLYPRLSESSIFIPTFSAYLFFHKRINHTALPGVVRRVAQAFVFRHTFATRMREAGADVKATAEIMGHTEVELTLNTYTDASDEFKRQEIALLDVIDAKRAI